MTEYKKRIQYDVFDKHSLIISELKDSLYKYTVYDLSLGASSVSRVKFTVGGGHTLVTGDYGTYVFEREFHPHPKGSVSEDYWIGKIPSNMNSMEYSSKVTMELISDLSKNISEYGYDEDKMGKIVSALLEATNYVENEHDYYHHILYDSDLYSLLDAEDVPWGKDYNHRMDYIFDAFEKMCSILESRES